MQITKRLNFLFIIGLILTFALSTVAFANGGNDNKKKKQKRPKNTGILSVTTSPEALPVRVDGQQVGMSGVGEAAEFYLQPGPRLVEVEGPNGQKFTKEINIVKNRKECICLNIVKRVETKECPYDMRVDGPTKVTEGDFATFVARNVASVTPVQATALNYVWKVTPSSASFTGQGTPAITVDTTGLGNRTVSVEVDVTDGVYDASCRQRKTIDMPVEELPKKPKIAILYDEFTEQSRDETKARLDNLNIELQNNPTVQSYIIMYQGTDKKSQSSGQVDKLMTQALDYLVKTRGADPSRIQIVKSNTFRRTSTYQVWLVPPGAPIPVPND